MTTIPVPDGALYGAYNYETDEWTGDWFYSDSEAQDGADGCNRSGLPIVIRDIATGEWLGSSGF